MYNDFFELQKNPFRMTPDPEFLFLTQAHREALAGLTYSILDRKGFVVVIGDAGTGKTTLLARLLQAVPDTLLKAGVILNPTLTAEEFLETLLLTFGILEVPESKPRRLLALKEHLLQADKDRKICAVLVDEAHKLTPALLEEIRLIGNLEHQGQKLLQIVLLGQEDLSSILNRDDLRQLKQRIATRFNIGPLEGSDLNQYVDYRWQKAGGTLPVPFHNGALAAIKECSKGIPRVINAVCDNALMLAFAAGARVVTAEHIRTVCRDLDLTISREPAAPPAVTQDAPPAPPPVPAVKLHRNGTTAGRGAGTSILGLGVAVPMDAASIRLREVVDVAPPKRSWFRRLVGNGSLG